MKTCALVVNNDPVFLELMQMLLTDEGMDVITAYTSNNGYTTIEKDMPDVVILDIRLEHPEAGWNLLQLIRLNPKTRNIPVIVCSVDSRFLHEKEQQLQEKGCCVLEKPFDLADLLQTLDKALKPSKSNN
jgi:two-component system alkaline phosphatase synthesis response regulator PhoP